MVAILVDDVSTLLTVRKWVPEIRKERENLEDNLISGCLATVTTKGMIVHAQEMYGMRLSRNQIVIIITISHERVENI